MKRAGPVPSKLRYNFMNTPPTPPEIHFTNPLLDHGPDPFATESGGFYYAMVTEQTRLGLRRTRSLTDWRGADYRVLWEPSTEEGGLRDIWAPELHRIEGRWYVYFTATTADGADENRRLFVMEHDGGDDPFEGAWRYSGPLRLPVDRYAIDGTVLEDAGRRWFLWSSKLPLRGGWWQHLMIAEMLSPTELGDAEVVLSKPDLEWECDLQPTNEAPQILTHGGDIFVAYSASAYWSPHYQLGMLRARSGTDLADPAAWTKSPQPLFSQSPGNGVFGPGHNSFVRSPDGAEDWILYHAWPCAPGVGVKDQRSPRAQRFGWREDGWPEFGEPVAVGARLAESAVAKKRKIWINEDNASFYDCRPQEDMTVEGLNSLVDRYATDTGVAGVLFNVNVQRALFDSRVWEPVWHGYDPEGPDDQLMLRFLSEKGRSLTPDQRGRWWIHNLWLLKNRGIDHPKVWLDRCRHHGIEGWLTMRMNDCHLNPEREAFWHCTLWKERPDLHRATYRDEGWFESAFDYGKPEVVEHHLALLRELFERYDLNGIELDWVRWIKNFAPGGEVAGREILNDFLREARRLADAAAVRLGHPVALGVRLPSHLQGAWAWGYDVFTWAREDLVDQIILAPFLEQTCFEFDLALWRNVFGDRVRFITQIDSAMHAYPTGGAVHDYQLLFGGSAAALHDGADGIALFNECYRVNPNDGRAASFPGLVDDLLHNSGDLDRLRDKPRRQAVSYHQVPGPGMALPVALPVPLLRPPAAYDLGRFRETISLRIPLGPKPERLAVSLKIGFDASAESPGPDEFAIWVNARPVSGGVVGDTEARPEPARTRRPFPESVAHLLEWTISSDALLDGINIVEILPPQIAGSIVWAELCVD